jgi:membrane protease subunit HflC
MMKLNLVGGIIAVLIIIVLVLAYGALFTVYQTQQALLVRLGEPVRVITQSGLHLKIPLIDSVIYVDKRILDLENPAQEVIASDQKRLVVDAFARYKINNALKFYQSVGSLAGANSRLATLLNSALRRVLGESSFEQIVRDERAQLMARIREQLDREAAAFGINVVDVRTRRVDLPDQNSQAVYKRMQTERQREAAEFRAQGSQRAQEIRARADREVTVLVADATRQSEQIRGEGDGQRNKIFADAFNRDRDFFAFYRSMQAYEAGLKASDTRMLLRPDSDFFRYFGDPSGKRLTGPQVGNASTAAAAPTTAEAPATSAPAATTTSPSATTSTPAATTAPQPSGTSSAPQPSPPAKP